MPEIKCPTLGLAGSNDTAVPFYRAKMLHDSIKGSQLEVIDGADHALIWQHPGEFVRVVEEFLGHDIAGVFTHWATTDIS